MAHTCNPSIGGIAGSLRLIGLQSEIQFQKKPERAGGRDRDSRGEEMERNRDRGKGRQKGRRRSMRRRHHHVVNVCSQSEVS